MVHEIHRRQQIEQFSGGILKRLRLAGEKENGGIGGLQICCRRNRTGACHAKYFFFQRISPKGDKRVFWRDDKPQNSCNLSEQHFRHLFDNQLNQLFPNSEAVMLSKQLSSTTLKMKCMVVTVFSKRSLALRKSTGQQCSFTSGRLANTKR